MHCKRHQQGRRVVFALCDKDLVGKVLKEGNLVIDLKAHASFYVGDDEFEQDFESVNAVGKKSIEFLAEKGIIKKGQEKTVQGVPYTQVYRI